VLIAGGVVLPLRLAAGASDRPRAHPTFHPTVVAARAPGRWVTSWAASPQRPTRRNLSALGFTDQTVRSVVLSSAGGATARVRFSNIFGVRPLEIGRASIGRAATGAGIAGDLNHPLSFAGRPSVRIAPGHELLSDPVALSVRPLERLAISVFVPQTSGPVTQHAQAQQLSYVAAGNHALDNSADAFTGETPAWYVVDGLDVLSRSAKVGAVVALGDSITDGVGSTVNSNQRWPNDLTRRLISRGAAELSVVDEGIGGNRLLTGLPCCGPSALSRFSADVAHQAGATEVIVLAGINDIGWSGRGPASRGAASSIADRLIRGYEQLIARAHSAGLKALGSTLTPFQGAWYWTPAREAQRELVNHWILTSRAFDGVIDSARAVADPADPERLRPAYDSGDHLHPNDAGYQAIADAISLPMLLGNVVHRR
jgi:lysophospholipase L1-like esterase